MRQEASPPSAWSDGSYSAQTDYEPYRVISQSVIVTIMGNTRAQIRSHQSQITAHSLSAAAATRVCIPRQTNTRSHHHSPTCTCTPMHAFSHSNAPTAAPSHGHPPPSACTPPYTEMHACPLQFSLPRPTKPSHTEVINAVDILSASLHSYFIRGEGIDAAKGALRKMPHRANMQNICSCSCNLTILLQTNLGLRQSPAGACWQQLGSTAPLLSKSQHSPHPKYPSRISQAPDIQGEAMETARSFKEDEG